MGISDFQIVMAMDMDVISGNGRLLHRRPNCLHQIQVLVFQVWEVFRFEWSKGVDVITSNHDGALCNVVLEANVIDPQNSGVIVCQFTAEGVSWEDWPGT